MKTLTKSLLMSVFALGLAAAAEVPTAFAAPGDGDEQSRLTILDNGSSQAAAVCAGREGLCFVSGAASTVSTPPVATAVAGHGGADLVPRFVRTGNNLGDEDAWTVDVSGNLRRAALSGNALFIIYDAKDEKAFAEHEVTALWQAPVHSGNTVAARLMLTPDDGFRSGHTYRVRMAQIIQGKQVVLGEGSLYLQ